MELPDSLKTDTRRPEGKNLHILVMSDQGATRRFSVSTSFLWVMVAVAILLFLAVAVLAYMVSSLLVDYRVLKNEYDFRNQYVERMEYNRTLETAPDDTRQILERLDQAVLSAVADDDELALPQPMDTGIPGANGTANEASTGENPTGDEEATNSNPAEDEGQAETDNLEGQSLDPPAADTQEQGEANSQGTGSEEAAWASLNALLPRTLPEPFLDVDEFRFTARGNYSYYLKQAAEPGTRLRGRAITVFSLQDQAGNVTLVSDPEIDLTKPSQGYERGGKFNIISSKVYRGDIDIPPGSKALSAEVLAWDETSHELIFRKRVSLGGVN
ncbi:MAG: hypothetical protein LBE38_03195 [Deltaproteobacteria bacterium]|nr:hypothetical protein [Deltaproteobacteria bacterium]